MDLVAADPRGGSRVLADVVVADPTRSTAVMVTAVERGHAARLAAEMKVGKYGDHFPDETFVPLAVEIYGCLDSAFDGFLGTCARRAAELRAGGLGSVPMASRLVFLTIGLESRSACSVARRGLSIIEQLGQCRVRQEHVRCRFRMVWSIGRFVHRD
jgi:hypothetical protein